MKRLILPLLFSCLLASRAQARFENASAVARSQAGGGAFVSLADDASALFVNPAGIGLAGPFAGYVDYAEPAGSAGARESRLAACMTAGKTSFGLGWYRQGRAAGSDNLFLAGAAYRLLEGTQGSLISLGANAAVGRASGQWTACDVGVIVRPLPVISLAYAAGNVFGVDAGGGRAETPWRRVQRWGASYFWEDRVVLSFTEEHSAGRTIPHYGINVKTAVPVELMAGFSDGGASGGVRWTGARCGAVIAFSADEGRRVTWTGGFEMRIRRGTGEGAR